MTYNELYGTYVGIKQRCLNPNNPNYRHYGGRGIALHAEWVNSYDSFRAWILANLGERPDGCSLDRIDNDGNYEPGNLRWATQSEQTKNRRTIAGLEARIAELEAQVEALKK
jgi:hypothetical protein